MHARAQRVGRIGQLLRWVLILVPVVAWVAWPGLLLEALLVATVWLLFVPRLALHLGAGEALGSIEALIRASGLDLTRHQVERLLLEGMAEGDGCRWVTIHEDTLVRVVAEARARYASSFVVAVAVGDGWRRGVATGAR